MKTLEKAEDKAEILERLGRIKADSQRLWGKMTANQMVCHLSDAFRGIMGDKRVAMTGGFFKRTILKWVMMNFPPVVVKSYPTFPEIDQEIAGTKPTQFELDIAELERLIEQFTSEKQAEDRWAHPFMGKLTRREGLRWAYLHLNHHLHQFGA